MTLLCRIVCLTVVVLASSSVIAAERFDDLDSWVSRALVPYVAERLSTHPRFKGESLRFVVMENGNPQAQTNALALRVRDQLRESMAGIPGIRIAWQPDNPHFLRSPGNIDCTKAEVHYLIGIELALTSSGKLAAELRAIDTEDRSVVAGFAKSWRGKISARQHRMYRQTAVDQTFRGERDVPYEDTQADLLAAHLAHDLGCKLLQQTEAEYALSAESVPADSSQIGELVELVANNLTHYKALQTAAAGDDANAVLEGKAHHVDKELFQYWITLQPTDPELPSMSASAYVRLPDRFLSATVVPDAPDSPLESQSDILESLHLVELRAGESCRSYASCLALQVTASDDAVVFFLNYQLDHGLVRLSDDSCAQRATARVVRTDEERRFPLPPHLTGSALWSSDEAWELQPEHDTYYAIAASDSKAARALSQHIARLPQRCSASPRAGLDGASLQHWMQDLAAIIDKWAPVIDWHTIHVKNVY